MKLSIVILSFNTQELTRQCLESLVNVSDLKLGEDFEVVVVDNGSSDGSVSMIRSKFPRVRLVEAGENLGFSKGNNLGVQHIDPDSKYVLYLNSDTVVQSGTLSEMLRLMESDEKIGVATCKITLWNGKFDWDCHRGFPTPWVSLTRLSGLNKLFPKSRFLNGYNQGWKDLQTTHEVGSVVGAFMLVPRKVGEKINWWDEDYFLNGEDIDFCYRVKQAGHKVIYHPEVEIIHYRGASKGTREESKAISKASQKGKLRVAHASVDAMQLFYNKHLRVKYPFVVDLLVDGGLSLLRWKRAGTIS